MKTIFCENTRKFEVEQNIFLVLAVLIAQVKRYGQTFIDEEDRAEKAVNFILSFAYE